MENEPTSAAALLATRCELWTLQLLVESMFRTLPDDQRALVIQCFAASSEATISSLLARAQRDAMVEAMQKAVGDRADRLLRLRPPTG